MAKKKDTVVFSEEEKKEIQNAAHAVWDDVGYDCLEATANETGKDVNKVTISRSQVIEISLDAGRPEEKMKQKAHRDEHAGRPTVLTEDFFRRYALAPYDQLIRIVTPSFSYTRYGM